MIKLALVALHHRHRPKHNERTHIKQRKSTQQTNQP